MKIKNQKEKAMKSTNCFFRFFEKKNLLITGVLYLFLAPWGIINAQGNSNGTLGENFKTLTYYPGKDKYYTVSYYQNGYYEGATINFKDLWSYNAGDHDQEAYAVNGTLATDTNGEYYKEITSDFSLEILLFNRLMRLVVNETYNIKCIRLNFNLPSQWCQTSGNIDLRNYVSGSTGLYVGGGFPHGTFSGTGVSGYTFNPTTSGVGSHTITFTYGNKTIVKTISVVAPTTITESFPSSVYNTAKSGSTIGRLDLRNYVNQSGGSFVVTLNGSNQTLSDGRYLNLFNIISETDYSTTSRNIVVKYTYTNGPCTQVKTKTITVNNNNINISVGDFPDICVDGQEHSFYSLGSVSPKGGTFTATSGLRVSGEGNQFFVAERAGSYKITYSFTKNDYTKSVDKWLYIRDVPEITASRLPTVCTTGKINLANYFQPLGGTFSGNGVSGNEFDPAEAGIGEHQITYSFIDTQYGCAQTYTSIINVLELIPGDVSFALDKFICEDAGYIYLPDYVQNHQGGTFSGLGVSGDYLNPALAGVSQHNRVNYKIKNGSCIQDFNSTYFLNPRPQLTFNALPIICDANTVISLSDYVSPKGGTFSGERGVTGNLFHANSAGKGSHVIKYTFVNTNGCSNEISRTIQINGLIPTGLTFDNLPNVCRQSEPINLRDYVYFYDGTKQAVIGGTFSGSGVAGDVFTPSSVSANTYKITFTYKDDACLKTVERTIIVQAETTVVFGEVPARCNNAEVNLMSYVGAHTGGSFNGLGVVNNKFYPDIAGIGPHNITYSYKNGLGCVTNVSRIIKVDALHKAVTFANIPDKCVNSPAVYLRSYIQGAEGGGTFSGQGVSGDYFNPAAVSAGTYTVTWSEKNGACTNSSTTTIKVSGNPPVVFNALPKVCYHDIVYDLSVYTPAPYQNGVFSGPGVIDGKFYAEQAGIGNHVISYTYKSGDCEVIKQQTVVVGGLLNSTAMFSKVENVCVSGSSIDLSSYVNVGGGTFSGPGVTGNLFNPSTAGVGPKTLKYTLVSGSCSQELVQIVDVQSLTAFTLNDFPIVCTSSPVYLNNFIQPFREGGSFLGLGVENNIFYPERVGVGQYLITFSYKNSVGCETILTKTIFVDQLLGEVKFNEIANICKTSSSVYLPDYIEGHSGGTFSGQGVNGEYFNPANVNPGVYTIKYKVTGGRCNEEFSQVVVVSEGPKVSFSTIPPICFNKVINLNNYVSHTGKNAVFSGTGVNGDFFNPEVATRGQHTITYSYVNDTGCETVLTQTVSVVDLLKEVIFHDLPSICESSPQILLSDYIENHSGGTFTGPGVQSNVFNPKLAGEGIHQITYTISNGSCFIEIKKNIEVFPQEIVTFNPVQELCYIAKVDLTRFVSPSGGVFSGSGVTGNEFDPLQAGIGSWVVEYTYMSTNGCNTVAKQTIKVVDLVALDVSFNALPQICQNGNTLYLPDFVSHAGGSFSGSGVTGNYFNPEVAGRGSHLISYTIAKGSCDIIIQEVVHVTSPDDIVFSTIPNVCYDAPINLNNYVSPQGGIFSGMGVEDGMFYPANVGLGDYTISYQYQNSKGCFSTSTKVIKVINLLSSNIVFSSLPELCPESSVINLREYVNSLEGEFIGKGVTDGHFDPNVAGSGVHKIEFRIVNGACRTERFQTIIVKKPQVITFTKVYEVCSPDEIDLSSFVVPKGGQFAGPGVVGNIFSPTVAGVGEHEIIYLLNDATGCVNQVKQTIKVTGLIPKDLSFNKLPVVCSNSSSLKLSDYLSHNLSGGVFSGHGVSGEYFNPSVAGSGVFEISYTIGQGNCKMVLKQTLTVKGKDDNVVFYTLPEVCHNRQLDLNDYVSKTVGYFSGVGVVGGKFNPGVAGVGTHTINYIYENELGCEFLLTQDIIVRDLMPGNIVFSSLPEVCPDNGAVKLSDYVNYSGSFSGQGVNGEYFNPANVNQGTYTVNFTYSSGICQGTIRQIITVKRRDEVFFSNIEPLCKGRAIELSQYVFPQGGTFSGPGISGEKFYPSLSGSGKHVITYRYLNELGCASVIQKEIQVLEMIQSDILFSALPDICVNSSPLKLSEFITNADASGKFTGTGVEGEYFNPLQAGAGAWRITYSVGSATACKETYIQTLVVHSNEDVTFSQIPSSCTQSPVKLFDYVSHKTGSFQGPGVRDNVFYPAEAGTGNHLIVYNYKSYSGCQSVLTCTVNVPRIYSAVYFNPIGELCQNSASIPLSGFVNVAGGNFSGVGVENNMFTPSVAKGGSHQITYTIGDDNCKVQTTEMITVIAVPDIVFDALPDVCFNETLPLDGYVSHKGSFIGRGVENGVFDPSVAGQGEHKITFNYSGNGCMASVTKTINVLSLNDPIVEFFRLPQMCVTASSVDLSMYTNAKGNFSGPGVTGNILNPSLAGAGTHELILSVGQGSCQRQARQYVTIYDVTALSAKEAVICNGISIDLNSYVNIQGGAFSGQGVAAHYFYPEKIGEFKVNYTYQNRNDCGSELSFLVKVQGMHPANIEFFELPAVCSSDGNIDLREFVSFYNDETVFAGPGVQGYFFSPLTAGAGIHQISVNNGKGSCASILTRTIQVNGLTEVTFDLPSKVCNEESFSLENLTNVQGASFFGLGVSSNSFYPTSAGLGQHKIVLSYVNSSGCTTTVQKTVNVLAMNPKNVVFYDLPDVCINQSRVRISDFISDGRSAVFSGSGVVGQYFYPSVAGVGTHTLTCKIGLTSGCVDSYTQIINVLDLPQVTFETLPEVCFDTPLNLRDYVDLEGGIFSGVGINDGYFYPAQAEKGAHKISYIISDDYGCESVLSQVLTVRSLFNPNITFSSLVNVCENGASVNLLEYISEFVGSFSGAGVVGTTFSPAKAGVGTHQVKYLVGDGSCAREFIQYITVYPLINLTFSPLPVACYNTEINLENYVFPKGGVFSGQGVSGAVLNTETLELGTHIVSYTFRDGKGCESVTTQILEVSGKMSIDNDLEFSTLPELCLGSSPVDLRAFVSVTGGSFSGAGVTGNLLNPAAAGVGVHLINYSLGTSTCKINFSQELVIKDAPIITFSPLPGMCKGSDVITLSDYVSHKGGTFSGKGVEDGILKRSLLTKGVSVIYYKYLTDNGCNLEITQTLTIGDIVPEDLSFTAPGEICENGGALNLFSLVNSELGGFSGKGVDPSGFFSASVAGQGTHRITYTVGQGDCQSVINRFITVAPSKVVSFEIPRKVCGKSPISLMDYVNYKGGTFSGKGVQDNVFYPTISGEGVHRVTYTFVDELCRVEVIQNLEVLNTSDLQINVNRSSVNSSALVKFWAEGFDISNYKWEFGDGGYSFEKEPFHYYYHTGTFDVTLNCEDTNGCKHVISSKEFLSVFAFDEVLKSSVVYVNDPQAKIGLHYMDETNDGSSLAQIQVYPNPFTEHIYVSALDKDENVLIRIIDITGKPVFEQHCQGLEKVTLYPYNLSSGVYFIEIGQQIKKIIKK